MPASAMSRLRAYELCRDFDIYEKYIRMLHQLVPEHYNYKKTKEYKDYMATHKRVSFVWKKRRYI